MCKVVRVIGGSVLASEIEAVITKPSQEKTSIYGSIEIRTRSGREFTYMKIQQEGAYETIREEAKRLYQALDWNDIIETP